MAGRSLSWGGHNFIVPLAMDASTTSPRSSCKNNTDLTAAGGRRARQEKAQARRQARREAQRAALRRVEAEAEGLRKEVQGLQAEVRIAKARAEDAQEELKKHEKAAQELFQLRRTYMCGVCHVDSDPSDPTVPAPIVMSLPQCECSTHICIPCVGKTLQHGGKLPCPSCGTTTILPSPARVSSFEMVTRVFNREPCRSIMCPDCDVVFVDVTRGSLSRVISHVKRCALRRLEVVSLMERNATVRRFAQLVARLSDAQQDRVLERINDTRGRDALAERAADHFDTSLPVVSTTDPIDLASEEEEEEE